MNSDYRTEFTKLWEGLDRTQRRKKKTKSDIGSVVEDLGHSGGGEGAESINVNTDQNHVTSPIVKFNVWQFL